MPSPFEIIILSMWTFTAVASPVLQGGRPNSIAGVNDKRLLCCTDDQPPTCVKLRRCVGHDALNKQPVSCFATPIISKNGEAVELEEEFVCSLPHDPSTTFKCANANGRPPIHCTAQLLAAVPIPKDEVKQNTKHHHSDVGEENESGKESKKSLAEDFKKVGLAIEHKNEEKTSKDQEPPKQEMQQNHKEGESQKGPNDKSKKEEPQETEKKEVAPKIENIQRKGEGETKEKAKKEKIGKEKGEDQKKVESKEGWKEIGGQKKTESETENSKETIEAEKHSDETVAKSGSKVNAEGKTKTIKNQTRTYVAMSNLQKQMPELERLTLGSLKKLANIGRPLIQLVTVQQHFEQQPDDDLASVLVGWWVVVSVVLTTCLCLFVVFLCFFMSKKIETSKDQETPEPCTVKLVAYRPLDTPPSRCRRVRFQTDPVRHNSICL